MAQRQAVGFQDPARFIAELLSTLDRLYPGMEEVSRSMAKDRCAASSVYRRDTRRVQQLLIAGKRLSRPRWC